MLGTILSLRKKMSNQRKGALYHQYDLNFHNMCGDDWLYAVSGLESQRLQLWTYNGSFLLMKLGHESYLQGCVWIFTQGSQGCVWNYTQYENCPRIECLAWITIYLIMWVLHSGFNPVELRICCKIVKLAGSIFKAREGQSACCLSSDCLERAAHCLEWNMWKQLKSGKLHTIVCTWNNCVTDFVFNHRLVHIHSVAFGEDKGEEGWA